MFYIIFCSLLVPKPDTRSTNTKSKESWFFLSWADRTENNNRENTFQDKFFSQIFYVAFWIKGWYFNRTGVDATASPQEQYPCTLISVSEDHFSLNL